ncbi:AMP-binding protein [Marinactinospora thermotolerans]|uniref:AMP-binding protein n=1 Tax=Marinactinospora thermotolerans TaxID=531310 RepID=UPI003D9023F9
MQRLSYASGTSDFPLLGETIGENLRRVAERFGERDALVEYATGRRWTYAHFDAAVDEMAKGLIASGVAPGDRVGIWSPNCAEWVITQYAAARAGAILVNLNPAYRTHELAYALRQSGTSLLVSATEFKTSDYRRMVEEVRPDCPQLREVVHIGTPDWAELIARGRALDDGELRAREAALSCDDPVDIQYTSGTTGTPKGATLTHHNILNNGFSVTELLGTTEHDRFCVPVPFYHCFGMVMANLGITSHGACIVIPAPVFDAAATLAAVQAERCTALYGVPTMFIAELDHPDFASYDLSSLRTGIMAGSPCPVEVMKRVVHEMHMSDVAICYGMTETSPVSTQTRIDDDLERRVSTIGRVAPHIEVKVVDPANGRVLPRGQAGELCTRGYSVMRGYWREPAKTAEAVDEAGWMHTGDLAVMREDGYLTIVGRIKDMVIRGGENIYPREVEEFFHAHPDIADIQVVGVPDPRYGEELCAWVRLRAGAQPLDAAALRDFAAGRLSHHKIPRYVLVVDDFPMTVTGKVRKVEMRERSVALLGLGDAPAGPAAS